MSNNYMGYVVGMRIMKLYPFFRYLRGEAKGCWYSPRQKARCGPESICEAYGLANEPPPHDQDRTPMMQDLTNIPRFKCGINMYSLRTIAFRKSFLDGFSDNMDAHTYVYALTKGWGKVAIHEDGYRVQQALITHLLINPRVFQYKPDDVDFLPGFFKRGTKMVYDVDEFKDIISQHPNSLTPIPEKEVT